MEAKLSGDKSKMESSPLVTGHFKVWLSIRVNYIRDFVLPTYVTVGIGSGQGEENNTSKLI